MFQVQLEKKKKPEKAQEVTQGELKYGSVSVEGITGGFEWGTLNNDWHGKKCEGNNFQFIQMKFEGDILK